MKKRYLAGVCSALVIAGFSFSVSPAHANQAPIGWLDGANCDTFSGWVVDMDTPNNPTSVHFYDGLTAFLAAGDTTTNRGDVNNGLSISGTHGFNVPVPASIKDGQPHTIYAYGIDTDPAHSMNAQLAGSPKTITCAPPATPTPTPAPTPAPTPTPTPRPTPVLQPVNHAPVGWLDTADCTTLSGWTYDADTPNSQTSVHFYDGLTTFVAAADTTNFRADINSAYGISGNHGYSISTPTALKDGRVHTIYAYGIDTDSIGSLNAQLAGSPKTITCASPVTPTPMPTPIPPTPTPWVCPPNAYCATPIPTPTPLVISTDSPLPNAKVGTSYTTIIGSNYTAIALLSWNVLSGSLPPGLTFDATPGCSGCQPTALISGTPATAGTYTFTIQVSATPNVGNGPTSTITKQFTLTVDPAVSSTATITVTSPNGGETYKAGNQVAIQWTTNSNLGNNPSTQVDIMDDRIPDYSAISLFGSVPVLNYAKLISSNGGNNTYEYLYTIPSSFDSSLPTQYKGIYGGNHYKVHVIVIEVAGTGNFDDSSDASFTIIAPTVATQPPVGWLDVANCNVIGGWAYNPGTPNDAIRVDFRYDNGNYLTDIPTDVTRPDVNNALGISGTHGFNMPTPGTLDKTGFNLKDGQPHTIYAYAIDSNSPGGQDVPLLGSPKTIQCSNSNQLPAVTVLTPNGGEQYHIGDQVNVTWKRNWAPDKVNGLADVYIRQDGGSNQFLAGGAGDDSGLQTTLIGYAPGNYKIIVTSEGFGSNLTDESDGSFTILPRDTTKKPPSGFLDIANCDTIAGWAYDPESPSSPVTVRMSDQGKGLIYYSDTDVTREDVNQALGISGAHGFKWLTPRSLKDGQPHTISLEVEASNPDRTAELYFSPATITCSSTANADDAQRISDIENVQNAIESYFNDNGQYPQVATYSALANVLIPKYVSSMPIDPVSIAPHVYSYAYNGSQRYQVSAILNQWESDLNNDADINSTSGGWTGQTVDGSKDSLNDCSNPSPGSCAYDLGQPFLRLIGVGFTQTNNTVVIHAKGTPGAGQYPHMELRTGSTVLGAWNVTGDWADYTATVPSKLSDNLRVYFTNDYFKNGEDRNLFVDYITLNGATYQSEATSTYAKGAYVSGQGCTNGFLQGQELDCNNSYFEYPVAHPASTAVSLGALGHLWMANMFSVVW